MESSRILCSDALQQWGSLSGFGFPVEIHLLTLNHLTPPVGGRGEHSY
jgi:hypothetical protein